MGVLRPLEGVTFTARFCNKPFSKTYTSQNEKYSTYVYSLKTASPICGKMWNSYGSKQDQEYFANTVAN